MSLFVQKFGGTSLGSVERVNQAADTIIRTRQAGHQVVVVVSAMGHETDRLIELANNIACSENTRSSLTSEIVAEEDASTQEIRAIQPSMREYAALVSTGEQISAALLSLCLEKKGYHARSFTGSQAGILTDSQYEKARIVHIDEAPLRKALADNCIPVVTGFQGMNYGGEITTLGRGGSDTTAVALAACLSADECQIFTDVDGVYTTDPRIEPKARLLKSMTAEEMLELSSLGSKVLQVRSVEFAQKYHVPLRVLSSFNPNPGTKICRNSEELEQTNLENPIISGITYSKKEAKLTLVNVPDNPGTAAHLLSKVSQQEIEIDMIVHHSRENGTADFTFTVHRDDYLKAMAVLDQTTASFSSSIQLSGNDRMAKLSLVGVGMRNHASVAQKLFEALAAEKIHISLISASEIKISVIINEEYIEAGIRAIHTAFRLDVSPKERL